MAVSDHPLLGAPRATLHRHLLEGHRVEPEAIENRCYRGVSLGLPPWVERLSWKTFRKTFHRDPRTGHLRGWNVRMAQTGLDGPAEPLEKNGRPFTFGHYRVVEPAGHRVPRGCDRGLLIHYGLGGNGLLDPLRFMRDPLVALTEGSVEVLLGWSYMNPPFLTLGTPSYFLLFREGPLVFVADPPREFR
jgi:hypothetical protein